MINLSDELASIFLREGPRAGYEAVFRHQRDNAIRALLSVDPRDAAAVSARQVAVNIYEKDLLPLWQKVEDYAAKAAAKVNEAKKFVDTQ